MTGTGPRGFAAPAVVSRLTVPVFGGTFALSGATGGIFGQDFGALAGPLAATWGWRYVRSLSPAMRVAPAPPRPFPDPDRYRMH